MSDDNHKRKKKRGRNNNKLNLRSCFRSSFTPDDNHNSYSDARNHRKNGRLGKPVMIAVPGGKNNLIPDVDDLVNVDSYPKRSPPPRRRISRLLKAVLFNSLMVKKIANSLSKSPETSEANLLVEKIDKSNDDDIASGRDQCTDMDDSGSRHRSHLHSSSSSSRTTSCSYSSSSSSSSNSNLRSSSDQKSSRIDLLNIRHPITFNSRAFLDQTVSSRTDQPYPRQDSSVSLPLGKPKPMNSIRHSLSFEKGLSRLDSVDSRNSVSLHPAKVNNYWNIRWYLFIFLSLIVLMVYGRIYSILCTSTWFYLVPCGKMKRVKSVSNAVRFFDTESEQYKKRVIMAGLLDRTRNPHR